MLEEVVGAVVEDPAIKSMNKHIVPKAPGMKYRHYAPDAELIIFKGNNERVINHINKLVEQQQMEGSRIGIIATKQTKDRYKGDHILVIGDRRKPDEIAANLFRVLREFDERKVKYIYSEAFSNQDIGYATMNRLLKAAGDKVIHI